MGKRGRPTDNKKTKRFEIRLTSDELERLDQCAKSLNCSRTEVMQRGIVLVYQNSLDGRGLECQCGSDS